MPPGFVGPGKLEQLAADFLNQHHPGLEIPVPIEEIVEFGLGLDIVPEDNLYREFGIEGWLSQDESAIHVDGYQFSNMEQRCRFTLAHEVAHLLLHSDLYKGRSFDSVERWLRFQAGIDEEVLDNLEWQARNLAGRILVPTDPLMEMAQDALDRRRDKIPSDVDPGVLWGYLAIPLSYKFNVSEQVIEIRFSGDGVGKGLRLREPPK